MFKNVKFFSSDVGVRSDAAIDGTYNVTLQRYFRMLQYCDELPDSI
jgi:hypothetical protein